ncbi:hypothetical protein ACN23B_08340 [Anabaena sp. FACHB-709]|uniref:Uncharacterized protein n=2 Tax=Nostocaceae TaxID=1162 RepID=A0A1Z4KE78_ANAVA|nr:MULTISPECIES: hypothetical protein [Nostocaceae]BAY67288.1 hypothetical protein NIES23_00600 [Trichormus variabilis NIES-23]MBD2173130.1 hypothetical protein [Anabaena cylindrica FACHB-318]MBD2264881.1 hypothetical protein [Anabaena sp. FACHB-709]MBD2274054.1 hypothetical protein [Nostoc sp. PCC 7120 = FACHB-418]MBD2285122.1 hypothetical protein [Anabaena cylindrica FACHB-170]
MKVCPINSKTLRQIWSLVEQTQSSTLLRLSDTDLVKQLLKQLNSQQALSSEEINSVNSYLSSRTNLIRDLATARLA